MGLTLWVFDSVLKLPALKAVAVIIAEIELRFKAGPPLDLSFWSFLTFLHHGIEEVETHLL